jgi:seryl-tRNA(Sec) selenium transferase
MKRRNVIKALTLLPLTGSVFPLKPAEAGPLSGMGMGPLKPGPQIFQSIGVEPLINCMGTFTIIGGSLERRSVRAAMEAASSNFVQYDELAEGIGKRLGELTGAEWGIVSAGCASCLKAATIACVAGGNPEKLIRIPDLSGFEKTEVVIPRRSRNVYDHAVRNVGVKVINVDTVEEMEQALNSRTAMIYLLAGNPEPLTLEAIVKLARPLNIPVLVDAAAEDLTVPNVHLQQGATMVAYSGGKALCGPQCSGILLGPKGLMESAWHGAAPHHGPARDNKVGREEMIGALAAIEAWITFDHKQQWKTWLSYLDTVSRQVSRIDGVKTTVYEPEGLDNHSPALFINWDSSKLHITGEEVAEELGRHKPRVALSFGNGNIRGGETFGDTSIRITAGQMQPGEDKVVAERVYGVLSARRSPKAAGMKSPASNINGRWDVEIEFYSSKSPYTWIIEQDGNWLQGMHSGELSEARELIGTIEGNQVMLRSSARIPGDNITFTYTGTLSGDEMSGSVYMVEYGTAKFSAKRNNRPATRRPITVPGGPPLAT